MTRTWQRLALTCGLTLVVVAALASAATLGPAARRMPLVVGLPTLALLLFQLMREWRAPRRATDGLPTGAAETAVFAWLVGLVAGAWVFGMLVGLPLFLAVYLRGRSRESWSVVLGVSLGVWAVLYGLSHVLGIRLHEGLFDGWWA